MVNNKTIMAAFMHNSWSDWMSYLFSKSAKQPDGSVVIPKELVERWERQINTPYEKLSSEEQASDLQLAEELIILLSVNLTKQEPPVLESAPKKRISIFFPKRSV